jgi:hypothetical protein
MSGSGNRWFRFYAEVVNDAKVQRLSPTLFKTWVNLLCLASSQPRGRLPTIDDIAFQLRLSVQDAGQQLDELILAGLIDIGPDGVRQPHNWETRQFVSDTSTERVRKHRASKGKNTRNVSRNVSVTPPDSDSEGEEIYLPSEQEAAREAEKVEKMVFGGGRGGEVSSEARRKVAASLAIGDASPLVAAYHTLRISRKARDPDALFISQAPKLWARSGPDLRAACQPLSAVPHPNIDQPKPVQPSAALVATLKRPRHAS